MKNEDSVLDILDKLEATPGRLDKEEIMRSQRNNELLKSIFIAAGDPYIDYGIKKFKKAEKSSPVSHEISTKDWLEDFFEILEQFASRELTGNAARSHVEKRWQDWGAQERKWFERILYKNLRCGVSESIVEKTWPGLIKKFAVQLAETSTSSFVDGKLVIEDVTYPVHVDPKLDGLRLIAIKRDGVCTLYTRNGTVLETLPRIKAAVEALDFDNIVLDGEGMASNAGSEAWNESASVMMAHKTHKDDKDIVFNVFDGMGFDDWVSQDCKLKYSERFEFVKILLAGADSCVKQVPHIIANNADEVMQYYTKCLDMQFEGVMLKDLDALYKFKRSKGVKKLKPVVTHEGVIVDHYTGNVNTKREGLFGGFFVLLPNGAITKVGGGFTDKLRAEIQLDGPDAYLGKVVECESQPPLTEEGKMRFPVFCRFRDKSDVDPKILEVYEEWCRQEHTDHGVHG